MIALIHFLAADINVGTHVQRDGLDLDTIWSTAAAMVIVIGMGLYLRAKATSGVPGKLQLAWEILWRWCWRLSGQYWGLPRDCAGI